MKKGFLYHKELKHYDFGEGHPFRGERFERFLHFFEQRFSPFQNQFEIISPQPAGDEILQLVHTKDYIEAIRDASQGKHSPALHEYVSADNINPLTGSICEGIEEASRIIVGSSVLAAELIAEGKFCEAVGIGGGLHHAKPRFGEGFCFYNDVAICVEYLKHTYNMERILVLDTDAHAGNGTAEIFYHDPRVLFIDIHQDPRTLYPGTGFVGDIGAKPGEGFTVNLPLLPGAAQDSYEYLFEEIIFPLAEEFRPHVVIRYGGSDPHYLDTLTALGLTIDGFKMIGRFVREIAQRMCGGKDIEFVTSGYNLAVLPFGWSALIAGAGGLDIDLSDLEEQARPPREYRLVQTKEMAQYLKKFLKIYWRCMEG
ncbi:MAG: hypothetical protein JSW40_08720 [Candidatus Omnitrophota bacterium]|nr:MAG: hypothetical protein JSW40_08720 [Candidatus Omnitrophota bacterium]